jgi:hypothetical protein
MFAQDGFLYLIVIRHKLTVCTTMAYMTSFAGINPCIYQIFVDVHLRKSPCYMKDGKNSSTQF